jgi:S-methylmethionine-dependent homocysteine/selenocysteine methylase
MNFEQAFQLFNCFLMEGALGERLKREYQLVPDENVVWANLVYACEGRKALKELWEQYITIAQHYKLPFLATTPTRRANKERVFQAAGDISVITDNVCFLREIRRNSLCDMYIGGLMGCKGDAYSGEGALSIDEAHRFHSWQVGAFYDAGVDFIFAGIIPSLTEATGIAKAVSDTCLPYIISFTIQSDGKLIDGTTICDAIEVVDNSVIDKPLCYMTNCVHPIILEEALSQPFNRNEIIRSRFLGIQANTSPLHYSELDNAADLKITDPAALANNIMQLQKYMNLKIIGGCCGTDDSHMEAIASRLGGYYR